MKTNVPRTVPTRGSTDVTRQPQTEAASRAHPPSRRRVRRPATPLGQVVSVYFARHICRSSAILIS